MRFSQLQRIVGSCSNFLVLVVMQLVLKIHSWPGSTCCWRVCVHDRYHNLWNSLVSNRCVYKGRIIV